jgi:exonuclease SbcC
MRITNVTIKNFCQLREREDEFAPGVICIRGRNGAGKSNYMKAILYALTGTSSNNGKKEEDLRWGEEKGSVKVEFERGGVQGWVLRDISSAKCTMKYGDQKFKSAKEVEAAIYGIIGVSPKVLQDMVFVAQGMIEGVLFQRPAERAKALQSLFGTEHAEKIRELLLEELDQVRPESMAEAIEECEEKLKTFNVLLLELELKLREETPRILSKERTIQMQSVVEAHREMARLTEAMHKISEEASTLSAQQVVEATTLSTLTEHESSLAAAVHEFSLVAETARKSLASYDASVKAAARRASLAQTLESVKKNLSTPKPPDSDVTDAAMEQLKTSLSELNQQIMLSRKVLAADNPDRQCPTCGQRVSEACLLQHRVDLQTNGNKYAEVSNMLSSYTGRRESARMALERWQKTLDAAERDKQHIERELASLAEVPQLAVNRDELLAAIADAESSAAVLGDVRTKRAVSGQRLKNLESRLATLKTEQGKLTVRISDIQPVVATPSADAQALLASGQQAAVTCAELNGRIKALSSTGDEWQAKLNKCKEEESRLAGKKKYRDMVERARSVLHRDQLPRLVAQVYIKALNDRLLKYLELFEVPYLARIMEDLSITCTFGDRVVPSERLSGGEKVMLGIAFRFAVYDLFVSDLGLLILDEPTVYLDSDRIDSVLSLLEKAKGYSKSAGLQLIVITHETRLAGVFDQVIEL